MFEALISQLDKKRSSLLEVLKHNDGCLAELSGRIKILVKSSAAAQREVDEIDAAIEKLGR